MATGSTAGRQGFFQRYRWLFWNPVWLLIAVAWLVLVVWALRLRFGGEEAPSQTVEQRLPPPTR